MGPEIHLTSKVDSDHSKICKASTTCHRFIHVCERSDTETALAKDILNLLHTLIWGGRETFDEPDEQ